MKIKRRRTLNKCRQPGDSVVVCRVTATYGEILNIQLFYAGKWVSIAMGGKSSRSLLDFYTNLKPG